MKGVILATDGSQGAVRALEAAVYLAQAFDAELLGSVSQKLASLARCPVLVVP